MGVIRTNSTILGGYTPICNDCMVHLCWDISEQDYLEAKEFWDGWRCRECNPDYRGALKKFKRDQTVIDS